MTIQQEHWNTPAQGGNRRISVIGCGRWGTFLAWYLERSGQQVCLYGREGSPRMEALVATRTNGVTTLPESIRLTHSLAEALERDTVVISVGAQGLRGLLRDGYPVTKGFKVADVDPRREELSNCFLISDKSRCIAGSVLELVCAQLWN